MMIERSTPITAALNVVDQRRIAVAKNTLARKKSELGQFFTPARISFFMSSLFDITSEPIRLLDPGAGIGMLTTAFVDRVIREKQQKPTALSITVVELDETLEKELSKSLQLCADNCKSAKISFSSQVKISNFLTEYEACGDCTYSHIILNPPYKKIATNSAERKAVKKLGLETVNLYSAFLAASIAELQSCGQLVAIVPRSFCNGSYYLDFRKYMLSRCAIKQIHLFDSRSEAFGEEEVLQENIILHLVKTVQQNPVVVSRSTNSTFKDLSSVTLPFDRIVKDKDSQFFIHIPDEKHSALEERDEIRYTLTDLELSVSTGPVVDFRAKEFLSKHENAGSVPLLYAHHFGGIDVRHYDSDHKMNWIVDAESTKKSLVPNGYYTVVKRFSAKEEKRRIVARVVNPLSIAQDRVGIENHLNFFHFKKAPLNNTMAYGLAAYLNTNYVDEHFRLFSGHTQVNAGDLKQLLYPSKEVLRDLGMWMMTQQKFDANKLDRKLDELITVSRKNHRPE